MEFQFASDLHLEFEHNRVFMKMKPLEPRADVLLLAGDITYLNLPSESSEFFRNLSRSFEKVYIVPGNHEFYHGTFPVRKVLPTFSLDVAGNIHYLNNQVVIIGDTRLIFTSLWTRIFNSEFIKRRVSDFHGCIFDERDWVRYQPIHHNQCHKESLSFLNEVLWKPHAGPTVVVSHYVPFEHTWCSYDFTSDLQEFFHVDLSEALKNWNVDHWIHGHNHHNQKSFQIGNTRFHTNQLGYVSRHELSDSFRPDALLEV